MRVKSVSAMLDATGTDEQAGSRVRAMEAASARAASRMFGICWNFCVFIMVFVYESIIRTLRIIIKELWSAKFCTDWCLTTLCKVL